MRPLRFIVTAICLIASAADSQAATRIRIMPPDGGVLAAGQQFDIRVEATSDYRAAAAGPAW